VASEIGYTYKVKIASDSLHFSDFFVERTVEHHYNLSQLKHVLKAISLSNNTSIRIDGHGMLCLQHQVQDSSQVTVAFVQFLLAAWNDDPSAGATNAPRPRKRSAASRSRAELDELDEAEEEGGGGAAGTGGLEEPARRRRAVIWQSDDDESTKTVSIASNDGGTCTYIRILPAAQLLIPETIPAVDPAVNQAASARKAPRTGEAAGRRRRCSPDSSRSSALPPSPAPAPALTPRRAALALGAAHEGQLRLRLRLQGLGRQERAARLRRRRRWRLRCRRRARGGERERLKHAGLRG